MTLRPLFVVMLLAFASRTTAADGPTEIARDFFTAYAAGDVAQAASYWKSSAVDKFRAAAERTAVARCFVIRELDVRMVESTAARARVELDASAMTWSAIPDAVPVGRSIFRTIELVSEDGEWKIAAVRDREESLVEAIAAAAPEERAEIARSSSPLLTPLLASLLARRAVTFINQGHFADAAQMIQIAEDIAIAAGDGGAETDVMAIRGTWLRTGPRRDLEAASELAARSLEWAEAAKDVDVLARALVRHGRTRNLVLGRIDDETFQRVVALANRVEDITPIAQAHAQLSLAASHADDARESLRHGILEARYAEEIGDITQRLSVAYGLGGAYWKQGDHELAEAHLRRAVALAREARFPKQLAGAMAYLALVFLSTGRIEEFLRTTEEALAVGDPEVDTELLLTRASHRIDAGDLAGTAADLDQIEKLNRFNIAERRNAMHAIRSRLLLKQGRCQEALQIATLPCRYREGCGPPIESVRALQCLGRKDEAAAVAIQIIDDQERQRSTSSADAAQLRLWQEGHATVYESVAEILLDQNRATEALIVADRSKARILADARNERILMPGDLTGEDRAAYDRLNARIRALNRAVFEAAQRKQSDESLRAELERARTSMRELLAQSERALAAAPSRATRPVHDEVVPAPPSGVLVIEYLSTDSRVLAFAVTRSANGDAVVTAKSVAITRAELAKRVDRHLGAIEQRDLRFDEPSRELYDLLLAPFELLIRQHRALCIVPAGDLWRVPFHALKTKSGRYVIETTSVFYAPSLAALEIVRPPRTENAPATILALANPTVRARTRSEVRTFRRGEPLAAIPETEREVRALAQIYGKQRSLVLIGDDAHEGALKRESPNFSVLHIAAHGLLDDNAPWHSALALSAADDREDGLLEAREIAELPLRADLAVLSACETGRGRASAGEGIIGFSWALLAAGCPNAVVSQWRAESTAAMELMIRFHRDLVQSGRRSPSDSLRRAQLSLMRRYAHPYYWAPFIVVGRDR